MSLLTDGGFLIKSLSNDDKKCYEGVPRGGGCLQPQDEILQHFRYTLSD